MTPLKKISAFLLAIFILAYCILIPAYATETMQDNMHTTYPENVDPATVVSYAVTNGNLYFGQYTYEDTDERSNVIHLIGSDQSITEAVIPSTINNLSVVSIDSKAFINCIDLQKITIPRTVTAIADACLTDCIGLTEIAVDEDNPCYYSTGGALLCHSRVIGNVPFYWSALIRYPTACGKNRFDIPEGTEGICDYCFDGAKELRSIYIPSSVTYIGYNSFNNCNKLRDIYYGGSSSQWAKICSDIPFENVQVHCDTFAEKAELLVGQIRTTGFAHFLRETPAAVSLLSWIVTLLPVFISIRLFMGKGITERKKYLRYRRNAERRIRNKVHSPLYYCEKISHTKPVKVTTILLCILAALLILMLFIEKYLLNRIDREIGDYSSLLTLVPALEVLSPTNRVRDLQQQRFLTPFVAIAILLLILIVTALLVWVWGKIRNRGKRVEKIPMRIHIIKREGQKND